MERIKGDTTGPLSIAVVGTGIAGMAAAWLLDHRHQVTVFEQATRIGGHSNTIDVPGPDRPIAVDTGFIVYNEANYPNLVALFRYLGVATQSSSMSFSVSLDDGALEYAGNGLAGLFGQRRNLMRPRHWQMIRDILRFYREAPATVSGPGCEDLTLGELLERGGYGRAFVDDHLLPMAAAIWSAPPGAMRHHPARAFIQFCVAHGLVQVRGRPAWRTVVGGSRRYVRRLTAPYLHRIRRNTPVVRVRRTEGGVEVRDGGGSCEVFDRIVIATHADEALALLADASGEERSVLGAFGYSRNRAVLHSDPALMPRRRRVWSSWNYLGRRSEDAPNVSVSYWMNSLQGIDRRVPLFVTLNPWRDPVEHTVHAVIDYQHPVYDLAAFRAQKRLHRLQGARSSWFCGSYFGAGFHEDALSSGLAAAEAAGGLARPWARSTEVPATTVPVRWAAE